MIPGAKKYKAPFGEDNRTKWSLEYASQQYRIPEEDLVPCKCCSDKCHGWKFIADFENHKEMKMTQSKLDLRLKSLEKEFNDLQEQRLKLLSQRNNLDNAINQATEHLVRLQGRYAEVQSFLEETGGKAERSLEIKNDLVEVK